ncbi:hypothetical protein [Aquirufa antheringensis]|uniref:hypothetical protein n=1 Tax=Aquirufa antheringensis TaxID=2516559 RepID=UPI00208F8389|nr:hypothetical protein [Aquirufa antheringensis]USQ03143.1 hypothetical protein G9X63_03140 [Aquirufa antheringensis]
MTTSAIKKQVDNYLPLLPIGQQSLVLEVIKSLFEEVSSSDRIGKTQYNKEIDAAVARMDAGDFISHEDALDELS